MLIESENESEDVFRMAAGQLETPFRYAGLPHDEKNTIIYADGHAATILFEELPDPNDPDDNGKWQVFWLGQEPN